MTNNLANFAALNLSAPLLKALEEMKFQTPSPVQEQTIPWMLEGRDIIAQAQTGTGKTAAFALPILERLVPNSNATQALILAPTRELAIQVAEQFKVLSKYQHLVVSVLCGGQDYSRQLKQLREGAQVVVGTPGRILDHIDRGTLKLHQLTTFVLDEADEMLQMGFIDDIELIFSKLPKEKQIALFSATMPHRIRQIATNYLVNPVNIEIRSETATVKSIEQRFLFASPAQKPDALLRILAVEEYQGVIVFVRTKSATEEVADTLQKQGYRAMAIHGDITQALREKIIAQFRQGAIDILVATDVAARGLDVERVTHVINYDVPHDSETYVHRIGRTGRAGRSGTTILFVNPRESRILNNIERHTRQRIEKITVPDNYTIQQAKQERFLTSIQQRLNSDYLPAYRKIIATFLEQNPEVSAIDVAAILALLANNDKPWQCELPKQVIKTTKETRKKDRFEVKSSKDSFERSNKKAKRPNRNESFSRQFEDMPQELFRLEVGRVHGVKPGNIVGAIANEAGLQSRFITGLKIHDDHSTVRLPKGMPKEVFQDLNKAWVCGRQLKLSLVNSN
ncbi:ATP-dependent RNA helicase DeaD [Legionella beliardensis]|uniref:ATP-dependent RNA helicase DeaD n=1 Tax=Legionella beliardensis TaxID=91822 RepID=A0A378I0A9_9GAMM|nr:DEAD/DEAH box helicase [Legionella beliardensis]STX28181.1 ATP-dependent RNA helicase DeaD [Legionella beliardensis]